MTGTGDKYRICKNILGGPNSVLVDTVEYRNLSTKVKYNLQGELYDKTAGQLTGITVSLSFEPKSSDGKIIMSFKFDASAYKNHDLVVFETLLIEDKFIDEHKDPDDEKQTVHVPEIGTKAGKPKDGKVIDTVSYSNLIPGQSYVMTGWLVDKKTGKKIKGPDGSTGFIPNTPSGTVEVTLRLKRFKGSAVAFEECYTAVILDGKEIRNKVAEHKDITDKDQTVKVPETVKSPPPKTGDDNGLGFFVILLAAALAVLTPFAVKEGLRSRRQRREDLAMLV